MTSIAYTLRISEDVHNRLARLGISRRMSAQELAVEAIVEASKGDRPRVSQFIELQMTKHGIAPTFEDMAVHMGRAKSNIHRLILAIEERGWITHLPHRVRAIRIVGEAVRNEVAA